MHFYYLDPLGEIHRSAVELSHPHSIVDIDLSWITLGHQTFPQRLHGLACFERLCRVVPDNHQFTFRQWYEARSRSTHCVWYSLPKALLAGVSYPQAQAKSLPFVLQRFFPPSSRNKSVLCFVDMPYCEAVFGFVQGHCVCFKTLPPKAMIQVQHEWQYLQQAYPQWTFEHSVYITSYPERHNTLVQTHQSTVLLQGADQPLFNRIMLYGIR
jgi:hypothetical protein